MEYDTEFYCHDEQSYIHLIYYSEAWGFFIVSVISIITVAQKACDVIFEEKIAWFFQHLKCWKIVMRPDCSWSKMVLKVIDF